MTLGVKKQRFLAKKARRKLRRQGQVLKGKEYLAQFRDARHSYRATKAKHWKFFKAFKTVAPSEWMRDMREDPVEEIARKRQVRLAKVLGLASVDEIPRALLDMVVEKNMSWNQIVLKYFYVSWAELSKSLTAKEAADAVVQQKALAGLPDGGMVAPEGDLELPD